MKNPTPQKKPSDFHPYKYEINERVYLTAKHPNKKIDFLDVLNKRKSEHPKDSPDFEKISDLILLCNRIRSIDLDINNFWVTKRIVPSAGGRHPVDILILRTSPNKHTNKRLYYFNPVEKSLNLLNVLDKDLDDFYFEINKNLEINDSTIIWFSINTEKTGSKYLNPESLYWKDCGALIYCIQLACTYLDLVSCPLGTLAIKSFNKIFKNENIISGGGLLVGASTV